MRWLLLGYGDLANKRVASALQEAANSELVAVWGRRVEKVNEFAKDHGINEFFAGDNGLAEALVKEDVDAVYVCTPVDSHLPYVKLALEADKHVLCEKPMALNVSQCEEMIKLVKKSAKQFGAAYYRRCFPKVIAIKKMIESGQLGRIVLVRMLNHEWFCPSQEHPKYWRVIPERSGGGVSADIGSHRLDLLNYWFGQVEGVFSQKLTLVHNYEADDTAVFLTRLCDFNNAPAETVVSWGTKSGVDRLEIVGSELKLVAESLDGPVLTIIEGKKVKEEKFDVPENVHLPLVEDFVQAVQSNRRPVCSAEEASKTNVLLESGCEDYQA